MRITAGFQSILTLAVVIIAFSVLSTADARPRLQTGPDAEITYDGLHRVDRTVMDAVWVKPDLDLRPYDKIMLIGGGVQFRAVDDTGRRYVPGIANENEFPISEENRVRLQEEVREIFIEELEDVEEYDFVSEPGPGVLLLTGAIIDVVSHIPPRNACTGRCDIYLSEVGQATLVLELRDGVTNEILLRAVDVRAAEQSGFMMEASAVTAWAEARRLFRSWARRVVKGLNDFEAIDDGRL